MMAKRRTIQLTLITLVTLCFFAVTHFLYQSAITIWDRTKLEDLAARNIVRTEFATDKAINTIVDIQTRGLTSCTPETVSAFKQYVRATGSLKNIRMRSGGTNCAVFPSQDLHTDIELTGIWQPGPNPNIQLGILGTGDHQALAVLWKGGDHDIVAELSTQGLLYDMAPTKLRSDLTIRVTLNNGEEIATFRPDNSGNKIVNSSTNILNFTARSKRYPFKAILTIDQAPFSAWHHDYNHITDIIAILIGITIGGFLSRALIPPLSAIDEIDKAIQNGEFIPYFQPIINLQKSSISGFEMLARWIKPDGEIISPGRFIPLTENFDRIDAMLFSLLRTAGLSLSQELKNNPDLKMTFNVTPTQFLDPTFLPHLLEVVKLTGLPLSSLVAEITERQELADIELACEMVAEYNKQGIRIAIDDAGTGHNGLSSIQQLDVGILKLDKIFIDGIVDNQRSQQMIELLANLAHQYQMTIVAEGIETSEQAAAALSMGIDEGQGFYFSRPIPASDLLLLLDEQRQPLVQNNDRLGREKTASSFRFAS